MKHLKILVCEDNFQKYESIKMLYQLFLKVN